MFKVAVAAALVLLLTGDARTSPDQSEPVRTTADPSGPIRPPSDPTGPVTVWKEATPGYAFAFPRDHGSHPDYKIEWWYYTGNVFTKEGRRFGYQLTFFRVGITPRPANPSAWAIRDLFMTHVAITDVQGQRFRFAERLNRAGPGLAGTENGVGPDFSARVAGGEKSGPTPFSVKVWNDDWSTTIDARGTHVLRASTREISLDLVLDEGRPPTVHGRDGISQKGAQAGNASHYYSLTRMPTRGTLSIDGERVEVSGTSWMDHEFGTSFLEPEQQGWDWISLQLEDGSDLMLYQLRRGDGTRDPRSSATLVRPDGRVIRLGVTDFDLQPTGRLFVSPASKGRYPLDWRVTIPGEKIDLTIRAVMENQELRTPESTGVTYWEGAIDASGAVNGRETRGRGYLEMTGYGGQVMGRVMSGR